jgi:hypothetical protein
MIMCLTSESTTLPNAAPMITPMARSTTLPLNAKVLNSSKSDQVCRVGTTDAICLIGSLDSARLNGLIIYFLSARGSHDASLALKEGATSSHRMRPSDERCDASLRTVCPMHGMAW